MTNYNLIQGFIEGKTTLQEVKSVRNEMLKKKYSRSLEESLTIARRGREEFRRILQEMFLEPIEDWVLDEVCNNSKKYGIVYTIFLWRENQRNRRNRIKILLSFGESRILEYKDQVQMA